MTKNSSLQDFQEYICDCIDKLINNELVNDKGEPYEGITVSIPPQHGKSRVITETIGSYYLGRFPYDHVIEIAYGEDLAVKFGRRNKQKVEEFGNLFDEVDEKGKLFANMNYQRFQLQRLNLR